jgi:CHAD domain-containing protein
MNKSPAPVTFRLLQRRARALQRHLPQAVKGDDRGVHQARVATRRLREAVPVFAVDPHSGQAGKASRKIRRLTRALGFVRELDVAMHMLDELARSERVPRLGVEEVRAHVLADRETRRAEMLRRLSRVDADKLNRRLTNVADAASETTDEGWRAVLSTRIVKRTRRLAAAVEAAGQLYQPERLHEVRIAAKKLRYGLELAAEAGAASAAAHVRTIKRTQELLGRLNDFHVLQTHVGAVQTAQDAGQRGLQTALAALSSHIEGECRHLHGRYLVTAQGLKDLCADVPARVVPEIDRRSRRSLKMEMRPRAATGTAGRRP